MSAAVIPEAIAQLQRQLDQFRSAQPRGTKLPDSVWQAAVELAREHGVYSVAHHLRLDYSGLKKRFGGVSDRDEKNGKPAFVELIAQPSTMLGVRDRVRVLVGSKMRIQWKAALRPIGRACFGPGGKRSDDSYLGADARAGRHRASRRTQRH